MGFFNNFPYTNFHELNLDWILDRIRRLQYDMEAFVVSNILKYADPIGWDITKEYEANTIVSYGDKTYLSKKPVPAGIAITNPDYWFEVGDLSTYSLQLEEIRLQIADSDEGINAAAVNNYSAGELFWLNGYLCEALTAITIGDPFAEGSNYKKVTVEELLGRYTLRTDFDTLDNTVTAALSDITNLQTGLAENQQYRIKNHNRWFIDGTNGSDDNPGTQAEPFQTLERALELTKQNTEVRLTIVSDGTYYVPYDLAASASVHIKAGAPNVSIVFPVDTGHTWACYAAHWNLEGYDVGNHMKLTVDPSEVSQAHFYFDECLLTLGWVDVEVPIYLYGGSLNASNCSINRLQLTQCKFICQTITITNTDPSQNAYFINSSFGRIGGGASCANLTGTGGGIFVFARASFVQLLQTTPSSPNANPYDYAIRADTHSLIGITRTRLADSAANSVNGIYNDGYSYYMSDQGLCGNGAVRWASSAQHLQYWNDSTFTWSNVPNI